MDNKKDLSDLSIDSFKKWMKVYDKEDHGHHRQKINNLIGVHVYSKIDEDRLQVKMKLMNGYPEEVSMSFYENGGVISEVNDKYFIIEVDGGSFSIHRAYVTKTIS